MLLWIGFIVCTSAIFLFRNKALKVWRYHKSDVVIYAQIGLDINPTFHIVYKQ